MVASVPFAVVLVPQASRRMNAESPPRTIEADPPVPSAEPAETVGGDEVLATRWRAVTVFAKRARNGAAASPRSTGSQYGKTPNSVGVPLVSARAAMATAARSR